MQLRSITAVFAALTLVCHHAMAQPVMPKSFGALPSIQDAVVSPNGKRVALLETIEGVTVVGIYELDRTAPKLVKVGKLKARDLRWASDEYVLLLVSNTDRLQTSDGVKKYEVWRYLSISKDGNRIRYLFSGNKTFQATTTSGALLHTLPNEPKFALFSNIDPRNVSGLGWSVYKVNLATGKEKKFFSGSPDTAGFVVNSAGEPVVRIDYDSSKEERQVRKIESARNTSLVTTFEEGRNEPPKFSFVALSDDETTLYGFGNNGKNTRGIYGLNLETGRIDSTLYYHPQYDVSSLLIDPARASVIGVAYVRHFREANYMDSAFENLHAALSNALKEAHVNVTSMSQDRRMAIVKATYASKPTTFFLFDKKAGELSWLGSAYPALEKGLNLERMPFDYVASDGVKIPGYLTLPAGGSENLPMVVLPHGGPEARDTQEFDWWAAFYASRGYAVYQPNFRGSRGYGNRFRTSGYGEWGRRMQDDITEGVNALIADGVADKNRICIVGGSYGGYAALAGATLTPSLYACAVSVNGVADLIAMLGAEARDSEYSVEYWETRIGSRFRETSEIEAVSPFHQVGRVRAPVMIVHGTDDTVVPYVQALRMRDALHQAGKVVEFVELKGEDHWLSHGETRTLMLEKSIKFIDQHIGTRPKATN